MEGVRKMKDQPSQKVQDWIKRRERETQERLVLRASLENKYASGWGPKTKSIAWRFAWEEGHSAGLSEVELCYNDIARMIAVIIEEARS
jgi:hypothetical protein